MVRKLAGFLLGLAVVGLAFPGVAWAAETVVKATCHCCHSICCG